MNVYILLALVATVATWLLTALGAAVVIFLKTPKQSFLNLMLGFSAGVMIAASFWSLLQPAIERAQLILNTPSYLVVTVGFLFGAVFIWFSDKAVSYTIKKAKINKSNNKINRVIMLIMSITLHNIPEGLAVGVAFGLLKQNYSNASLMGAISIAVGIGLQNFPEGAAVSLPLRREGYSRRKSFFYGELSAIVEPIAGVVGAVLVSTVEKILPFALSFAAGAMIIVAVHELIPECQQNKSEQPYTATMGIITGFAIMMLLDVMLG
ncbi:MAG: ZIP family metal transporter [Clostridia bacterium]|nr:ZIP family metal transporter [Clostridia bacterium]